MNVIAHQAANVSPSKLTDPAVAAAAIGLLGVLLVAWINAMLDRRRARRERYAAMAATLAAWIEIPYMIRRRTSNAPDTITSLVVHLQTLQHQMNIDHADLRADSRWLAECRDEVQRIIQTTVKPYIDEAWLTAPITSTAQLIVGTWGPSTSRSHVELFVDHIRWRFGWRRVVNPFRRLWRRATGKTAAGKKKPQSESGSCQ